MDLVYRVTDRFRNDDRLRRAPFKNGRDDADVATGRKGRNRSSRCDVGKGREAVMAARHATITRWLLKRRRYNALQAVQNVQAVQVVQTVKEPALGTEVFSGLLIALMLLALTSCDQLPGKPIPEERWRPATEVTDFSQLYALNCSGCPCGADGRFGAARPLNDPLYLALVSDATLRTMIAQGVPGTAAPSRNRSEARLPTSRLTYWLRG